MRLFKQVDLSDVTILAGFGVFSYGLWKKYGLPDMCLVSGALLILVGIFFAFAASRKGK